jgi:tRNA dimethylallyltransferase
MQIETELLKTCWFLAGPTACGKTATALILAERLSAEIIALDSMSLYRGMDVGTAKANSEEQRLVPHHMIDVLDPDEEYSLAEYVQSAEAVCRDIVDRGKTPLFVGGTGLYLRGVLRGVFAGPDADWEFRKQLEKTAAESDAGYLHGELLKVDPSSAERLHPNDARRLIRALEVYHLTGKTLTEQMQQGPLPAEQRSQHVYWLSPPRDWLYDRINRRVDQMIELGLVDEVRRLMSAEKPLSRSASQALGYKEMIDHLKDECTLEAAIETIQTRTRQFAKRQHTWFRNLKECLEIDVSGEESAEEIAGLILNY